MPQPETYIASFNKKERLYLRLFLLVLCFVSFHFVGARELDSLDIQKRVEQIDYMPSNYRLKLYPDIITYYIQKEPAKALLYCYKFEEDVEKIRNAPRYSNSRFNVLIMFRDVYFKMKNYSKAQEYALLTYNRAVELNLKEIRFWSLNYLLKLFQRAESYDKIGVRIQELMNLTEEIPLMKIVAFMMQSDFYKHDGQLDSAKIVLEEGIHLNADSLHSGFAYSELYFNLADVYNLEGDYQNAFEYYKTSTYYAKTINIRLYCQAYIEMAVIKGLSGEFELSDTYFDIAYVNFDDETSLDDKVAYYLNRGKVEEHKRNFGKAAAYYKKQAEILAELNVSSLKTLSRNYENLNRIYVKEVENRELRLENDAKEDRINQARLIGYLIFGLMVVILFSSIAIFHQKNKAAKLEKVTMIQRNQLNENILKEQVHVLEIETTKSYINGQERERDRIGRDLHDSVGGALAGVRMLIMSVFNTTNAPELGDVVSKIQKIYQDVRNLSHDLAKPDISHENFEIQISSLIKQFELNEKYATLSFFPKINWELIDNSSLIQLYRIVQEALLNVIKHANAENVEVQFLYSSDDAKLNLSIEDDGDGFSQEVYSEGIGIQNMRTRVDILKGGMEIDSKPGEGTYINITIPIENITRYDEEKKSIVG